MNKLNDVGDSPCLARRNLSRYRLLKEKHQKLTVQSMLIIALTAYRAAEIAYWLTMLLLAGRNTKGSV